MPQGILKEMNSMKPKSLAAKVMTPVAAAAITAGALFAAPAFTQVAPEEAAAARDTLNNLSTAFNDVASKASPAVVYIEVEKDFSREMRGNRMQQGVPPGRGGQPVDPREFFERFFGQPGGPGMPGPEGNAPTGPVPFGQGSGFVVSADGYIVTNHHVVGEADNINVTFSDGRELEAKLIGTDPQTEIALIKVEGENLPFLSLGDSSGLKIGDWVVAIGSPFGLSHTVTTGIVSASGRGNVGIVDYADFIQTDAAINPGNSGGPLLNLNSEVIGMNTAILSRTGGSMGIGFAIPVNMIKYIETELRNTGTVQRGFLGVNIQNLTRDLAEQLEVPSNTGILVSDVQEDSPAAKAGIQRGDVIVGFGGQPVGEIGSFRSRISTTQPGSEVVLTIVRNGEEIQKNVAVGTLAANAQVATAKNGAGESRELGLNVQNLTSDVAEQLGYAGEQGVVVTGVAPNSVAARARLEQGDLIQEVNKQPVPNADAFSKALSEAKGKVLLLVRKGEGAMYVVLNINR